MSLTSEKARLYEAAARLCGSYEASCRADDTAASYFRPYEACRHDGGPLTAYESDEMLDLREALNELWADEDYLRRAVVPILLMAYDKTRDSTDGHLEELDLMNYMM